MASGVVEAVRQRAYASLGHCKSKQPRAGVRDVSGVRLAVRGKGRVWRRLAPRLMQTHHQQETFDTCVL